MNIECNPITDMIELRDTRGRLYLLTSPATARHWSRKDKRRERLAASRKRDTWGDATLRVGAL